MTLSEMEQIIEAINMCEGRLETGDCSQSKAFLMLQEDIQDIAKGEILYDIQKD